MGRRQRAVAVPVGTAPKISIALASRGHFTGQSSSRRPGRIEAISLLAGKRPPDPKRSESAVTNLADKKRKVQKIPKLVQRTRPGRNLPRPSRPPCGASIATLDPPVSFLAPPR